MGTSFSRTTVPCFAGNETEAFDEADLSFSDVPFAGAPVSGALREDGRTGMRDGFPTERPFYSTKKAARRLNSELFPYLRTAVSWSPSFAAGRLLEAQCRNLA